MRGHSTSAREKRFAASGCDSSCPTKEAATPSFQRGIPGVGRAAGDDHLVDPIESTCLHRQRLVDAHRPRGASLSRHSVDERDGRGPGILAGDASDDHEVHAQERRFTPAAQPEPAAIVAITDREWITGLRGAVDHHFRYRRGGSAHAAEQATTGCPTRCCRHQDVAARCLLRREAALEHDRRRDVAVHERLRDDLEGHGLARLVGDRIGCGHGIRERLTRLGIRK